MTNTVLVASYWPFFLTHELRRFDYVDATGSMEPITSVFSYDVGSKSMLYIDYDGKGTWKDTWYYQYRATFGVSEWRDDYPGGKKVVMNPPIGWGDVVSIGSSYMNKPQMNPFKSWPPAFSDGVQVVYYEDLLQSMCVRGVTYNDVLQFTYMQAWSGKPGTGARYWMANGVGPIAVQWLAQEQTDRSKIIQTARMDAVVTRFNT